MATASESEGDSLSQISVWTEDDIKSSISSDSAFYEESITDDVKCKKILKTVGDAIVEIRKSCDEPTKICKPLSTILDLFYDKPQYRKEISEELWRCGYPCYSCRMFKALNTKDAYAGFFLGKNSDMRKTLRLVVHILWNYTNCSERFSKALVDDGLLKEFCDFLTHPYNTPKEMMKNHDKEHIIMAIISVMRNIATNMETLHDFHEIDMYTQVKRYSHIDKKEIKLITYTTMALIATADQAQEVTADLDVFQYLVRLMSYAVGRTDTNRIRERYTSSELVSYLNKMTIDGNIGAIMKTNILDVFAKMVKSTNKVERYHTSKCLYNLTFDSKGREAILKHDIYPTLKGIEKLEKDKDIQLNIRGLLENLEPKSEPPCRVLSKSRHVFINYSPTDIEVVTKIVDRMTSAGIDLWVDYKLDHGDLLGAISQAVAESSVVVVCLSEQFHQSPLCRGLAHEAVQHAKHFIPLRVECKYKPDGWLQFILPNKSRTYIDFSAGTNFETSCRDFLKVLENPKMSMSELKKGLEATSLSQDGFIEDPEAAIFAETNDDDVLQEPYPIPTTSVSLQQILDDNPVPGNIEKMDIEKVKRWFINNDLSKLVDKMAGMDGKKLWELHCMKAQNRQVYENFLESQYKLESKERLQFDTCLRELCC